MLREAVLVSGGSGGIGAALCRRLAAAGYHPVVGYALGREVAEIIAKNCGGTPIHLDLASPQSIADAVGILTTTTPSLSGVVLAASPPPHLAPLGKVGAEEMSRQWLVNVAGPQQLLAGLILQVFRRTRRGIVLGVLSQAMGSLDQRPMAGMGAYVISKFGMAGMLAVLAADYPWLQIETVTPSFTDTKMLDAFDPRLLELIRAKTPFQSPDAVADDILQKLRQAGERQKS